MRTKRQKMLFEFISTEPERAMTAKRAASIFDGDTSLASRILQQLVTQGLIIHSGGTANAYEYKLVV